jgi:2-succinyl-6-hydroxy-2,4-cyclohexadiene-1-carboxylate synthase
VLLLHGFTGSGGSWPTTIVEGLASAHAGAPVAPVTMDLPGHGRWAGRTDPRDFTLSSAVASIAEAQGGRAGPLVGYSMGGRLALAYAVAHPARVTHLVLESASPGLAPEEERAARRAADEALARDLERDGIEAFVRRWEALPLFESQRALPEAVRSAQRERRLANHPNSLAAALRGLGTGALPSLWGALSGMAVPTLLLAGALDGKFVDIARAMAHRLPRAEVAVVADAGHAVHLERPGAWLEAVLSFLADGGRSSEGAGAIGPRRPILED